MNISLGSDHAGYQLKKTLGKFLKASGYSIIDLGAHSTRPSDYPDYARKVALSVAQGRADRGIMVCGSGVGASIAANKVPGARAGLCHDVFSARQGVEDDDVNVLCLGERVIGAGLAIDIVKAWIAARFSNAERHARRKNKIIAIEEEFSKGATRKKGPRAP
ncbi:MAG: ribose 5-phosphate isomerase B [Elusimicrobiota bacterium]